MKNTEWSELNTNAPNNIATNMLTPMVSQSNPIPNLQVRTDPHIPQSHVVSMEQYHYYPTTKSRKV